MKQIKNAYFKKLFVITTLFLFYFKVSVAQENIKPEDKIVFVYYENLSKNIILIPNVGKLHAFKIYRKLKSENESEFKLMAEKKKPMLPMRENSPAPWGVKWKDPDYHSRDIDYKILAFDKSGNELCQMQIIWDHAKDENKATSDTLQKN